MTQGMVLKLTWPCWPAMRSATATPSSSALCASMGPRTTSPTAHTPGSWSCSRHPPRWRRARPVQAHGLGVQTDGVGHTANGHDQLVGVQLQGFALGVGVGHAHALLAGLDLADLHAQLDLQALLVEGLLGFLGNLLVHRAQERGQAFQDGHVRTQAAPDRTHFQADDARANEGQLLGHGADAQRTVVGQHVSSSNGTPGSARALDPVATMICLPVSTSSLAPATWIS
jgi:hypothetical protein